MSENWKLNKITAIAEHSSGLRCSLENDSFHKNELKVTFLNEYSWKQMIENTDDMMRDLGREYVSLIKDNCPMFKDKKINVWTLSEENIKKNKDRYRNRSLSRDVLESLMKQKNGR